MVNGIKENSHTGASRDNPFNSVVWLANHLMENTSRLKKGMILMTGSTFATYFAQKGDEIEYSIDGEGEYFLVK